MDQAPVKGLHKTELACRRNARSALIRTAIVVTTMIHPWLRLGICGLLAVGCPFPANAQGKDDPEFRQADADLNAVYQALSKRLESAGKNYLRNVQRAWLTFKERDEQLFTRLAIEADDADRASRYRVEATDRRTQDLQLLGATPNGSRPDQITAPEADRMLNSIYKECFATIPRESATNLKEIQVLWLGFRDLHCRLDSALRNGRTEDAVLRDLTMNRVVQFRHYMIVLLAKELPISDHARELHRPRESTEDDKVPDVFRFAR
jgi:uncharacterized protein YecT (DUF1311 family)